MSGQNDGSVYTSLSDVVGSISEGDEIGLLTNEGTYYEFEIPDGTTKEDIGREWRDGVPRMPAVTPDGEKWKFGWGTHTYRPKNASFEITVSSSWLKHVESGNRRDIAAIYYDEENPQELPDQNEVLEAMKEHLEGLGHDSDNLEEINRILEQ